MKHRIRDPWKDRLPAFVRAHTLFHRERKRFLAHARNDIRAGSPRIVFHTTRHSTLHLCKSVKGLRLAHVRLSFFPYRHPERSRGIFVAAAFLIPALIRLHETPYSPMHGKSGFPFPFTRIHRFTANEKDFSLTLEMTHGRGAPRIVLAFIRCGDEDR